MKKALAFSGGKDSMACLHMERDTLDCAIYVDTGFTFAETQELVDYAARIVPVHVVKTDRAGQNDREGLPSDIVPIDWTVLGQQISGQKPTRIQSYLGCCYQNISGPLLEKAKELGITHLVYGQRNDESHKSPARNGIVVDGIVRLHPIEDWTADDVLSYLKTKMDVPSHYALKHSSLDCYDCTAFHRESLDRIAWMRAEKPDLYARYAARRRMLNAALSEAMGGPNG